MWRNIRIVVIVKVDSILKLTGNIKTTEWNVTYQAKYLKVSNFVEKLNNIFMLIF